MPNFNVSYRVTTAPTVVEVSADTRELAIHAAIAQANVSEGAQVEVMQVLEMPTEPAQPSAAA